MLPDGTEEIRRGHPGELWVRGPNAMKGYWRKEKVTAETKTSDGWLKTGDIAYVDDDSKWHIVDRKKVRQLYYYHPHMTSDVNLMTNGYYHNAGAYQSKGSSGRSGRVGSTAS